MGDSMVTRITLFCILLHFKCCRSHTSETIYFYFCLNIVYNQSFNMMVANFVCVFYVTLVHVQVLVTRITQKGHAKNGPCLNSTCKPKLNMQEPNKHIYFTCTILSFYKIWKRNWKFLIQGKVLVTRITICPPQKMIL